MRQDIPANSEQCSGPAGRAVALAHMVRIAARMGTYLPFNRMVVIGPRPPAPIAATWKRYFLPLRTLAVKTRLVVVFQALYFSRPVWRSAPGRRSRRPRFPGDLHFALADHGLTPASFPEAAAAASTGAW